MLECKIKRMWHVIAWDICTCGRCNANEASDHSLDGAKHGGLAEVEGVEYDPGEDAGGSAHVGVKDRQRCNCAHCERATTVEARPAHPKQACACKRQNHVV